ncbi:unnamed protein product [Closterium sp. Naga37s-1]|nr:unnamed protein product [Closterium sp. Naga37s-1]
MARRKLPRFASPSALLMTLVLPLRRFLLVGPLPDAFLLAMVIAGMPELSPVRAAVGSVVRGMSPPATASAIVAAKPPLPPALKTVSSPARGPAAANRESHAAASHPAAVVAPLAPGCQEPEHVAPAAVVPPPVSPVLAAPIVAAAPAAHGGDLVLAAVSATTGGQAPAVVHAEAVHCPSSFCLPAPYSSLLPGDPAPHAAGAAQPFQAFVGSLRAAEVPEAILGQLWRLCEVLRAVHLIQMYGHAGLSRGNSLDDGSRDE